MLAPRSLRYVLPWAALFVFFSLLSLFYWWLSLVASLFLVGFVFFTWFFRDPERKPLIDSENILSPADGTVIAVLGDGLNVPFEVKIRMSPFDVHINRMPIDGTLDRLERIPGKHSTVYFGDPSKINERCKHYYSTSIGSLILTQITGMFARRIEVWVSEGDFVKQGERIGIIRFGSETDLWVKTNKASIEPRIQVGDKVKAGITVVGRILQDFGSIKN